MGFVVWPLCRNHYNLNSGLPLLSKAGKPKQEGLYDFVNLFCLFVLGERVVSLCILCRIARLLGGMGACGFVVFRVRSSCARR